MRSSIPGAPEQHQLQQQQHRHTARHERSSSSMIGRLAAQSGGRLLGHVVARAGAASRQAIPLHAVAQSHDSRATLSHSHQWGGAAAAVACQHALAARISTSTSSSSSSSSSSGARPLAGKNIFQLRAAVEAVEAEPAADDSSQQQQPNKRGKGKQQPKEGQQHDQPQEPPKMVPLPMSDESEELLRIRHSVSVCV
jgi:hypothetical protein